MILAIDPGPTHSGYVQFNGAIVIDAGKLPNHEMLEEVRMWPVFGPAAAYIAIEMVASFGMAVGKEVFETVRWIGRFQQASAKPDDVLLIYRHDVKMHLCKSARAKDSNIRQALIDRFGPGKDQAIGRKSSPGPLYGVSGDAWSALAVAVTARDRLARDTQ